HRLPPRSEARARTVHCTSRTRRPIPLVVTTADSGSSCKHETGVSAQARVGESHATQDSFPNVHLADRRVLSVRFCSANALACEDRPVKADGGSLHVG